MRRSSPAPCSSDDLLPLPVRNLSEVRTRPRRPGRIRRPARRPCRIRTPTPAAAAGRLLGPHRDLQAVGRRPAESEEVVVHANAFQFEHVTPDLGEDLLGGRACSDERRLLHRGCFSPAAKARRSTFPLDVCGSASSIEKTAGTIAVGIQSRRNRRSSAVVGAGWLAATMWATSRVLPRPSSPATTAFSRTPGCLSSAASTSPGSIRTPRICTWSSRRPRYSMLPSGR